jgi:hypothetical protein
LPGGRFLNRRFTEREAGFAKNAGEAVHHASADHSRRRRGIGHCCDNT